MNNNTNLPNTNIPNLPQNLPQTNIRSIAPGVYQLHVFIEETRGLILKSESTIDPVIKMAAFGQNKYSSQKARRGTGMIYWSEHFFFEKKFSEYQEFEIEKLYIQVFDHNLLKSNSLIGELEVDLISIYLNQKHTIFHQWAGLTNIKLNREEIKGFIKFSCSCIGPNDEPITLKDEKFDETYKKEIVQTNQFFTDGSIGDLDKGGVLYPPFIKIKPYQIVIKLIKGEHLVKMDFDGTIDSFLVFEYGTVKYQTKTIKNNPNPEWNLIIKIPFSEPTINEILKVGIWDEDYASPNELVGVVAFELKDIKEKKHSNNFWLNLYGAHPDKSKTKMGKLMNVTPQMGSYWKGRIFLSIECSAVDSPQLSDPAKPEKICLEDLKRISFGQSKWQLIVDAYYGFAFPIAEEKYAIRVRWADREIPFGECDYEQGVAKWYTSKSISIDFPYNEEKELPDLFIYLCQAKSRVCFIRKQIQFLEKQPKLYYFVPDQSLDNNNKILKHDAGVIKMGFQIKSCQISGEKEVKAVNKIFNESLLVHGVLISYIYLAQDLIPADNDGSSDPFYTISYYGQKLTGSVVKKSLNPVWYKQHYMKTMLFPKDEFPPIIINVFDEDPIGKDFIGSCLLNVQKGIQENWVSLKENEIPKPVWHELEYENQKNCGKLLACFQFIPTPKNVNFEKSIDIKTPTEKYFITIKILGLRGLKSLGLFPVSKPFIRFDINGMKTNESKEVLNEKKYLQTQPSATGPNPNICTIISFELDLPKQSSFCPSLNCSVFDWILKGLAEPMLGVFTINFPEYIKKGQERVEKRLQKYKDIDKEIPKQITIASNFAKNNEKHFEIEIQDPKNITEPLLSTKEILNLEKTSTKKTNTKKISVEDIYLPNGNVDPSQIVRFAEYKLKKSKRLMKEKNIPDETLFKPLGFDGQVSRYLQKEIKKHYRHFLSTSLEKALSQNNENPFLDDYTFDEFIIRRGKRFKDENVSLHQSSSEMSEQKEVGKFKGWVSVISESNRKLLKEKKLKSRSSNTLMNKVERNILEKTPCLVRIYILRAEDLPSLDLFSESDPYLKLILGKEEQNNSKEYQTDKINCDFNKLFTFKTTLPGDSLLRIQVWDYDFLIPDDLIGETTIDLENRFFSKKWQRLGNNVPIETRELVHPLHRYERNGRITLWLEIHPLPLKNDRVWDITPKPPTDFELRVVIWNVEDVPSMDVEDCSDLYIEGNFRGKIQRTDTHFRAQNGYGSFNWRMVWPVVISEEDMDLTISFQVWDKDFFSPNDYIAEGSLSFKKEAKEAFTMDCSMKKLGPAGGKFKRKFANMLKKKDSQENEEKFLLELKNFEKTSHKINERGKMTMSLEIVPRSVAKENPVGLGRSEPNHSPWLPPPDGRFEWSANPLTLFKRCIGPKARAKVCWFICISLCIAILISIAPIVLGNLASKILDVF